MAEEKIAILMDSGGDLPYELCQKEGIEFLPLHVIYPEKDYLDGVDIDPMVIYRRFPDEIPSTSTPSIQEVLDCFESLHQRGFTHVIAITISSGLSSTGNTIAMASKQYDKLKVHVFDSKNISFGSGIFALWAARKNREGVPFNELVQMLENKRHDSRIFFYMDTLKYLRHGGRIGKVSSIVGDALHLVLQRLLIVREHFVYGDFVAFRLDDLFDGGAAQVFPLAFGTFVAGRDDGRFENASFVAHIINLRSETYLLYRYPVFPRSRGTCGAPVSGRAMPGSAV